MYNKYIEENEEAVNKIIDVMVTFFKTGDFIRKSAPIKSDEVVVARRKEKLYRYGLNLESEAEVFIHKNILVLKDYLARKYKLDRLTAESEASNVMCYHILKVAFEKNGLEFNSNYAQYRKKRDKYTYYKGISFIIVVIVFIIFLIIQG